MEKQIKLSVCIAVYNHWDYIEECFDSFIKYENNELLELVIVNDCSTDNTDKVINERMKKDYKFSVKYFVNEKNLWQVKTLSKAVENSSWELITFMDSDDFLIQSSLSKKLKEFENNKNLKIIYSNWVFFKSWKLWKQWFHDYLKNILDKDPKEIESYFKSNTPLLSISCAVIKKDFFLSVWWFDTSWLSNDWVTNIKVFEKIKNKNEFLIDYTPVFWYRIHNNNISQNPELQFNLLSHVINNYCFEDAKRKLFIQALFVTCIRYKMKNDKKKRKKYLNKLLKEKAYLHYIVSSFCCLIPTQLLLKFSDFFWNIKQFFKWKIF